MRERDIESYLRDQVRDAGGRAMKWNSPGNSGVPDRIVFLPGKVTVFVETKAPGKKPTALQQSQHRKLAGLGHHVRVIDSREQVDELLTEFREGRL
ncbi:VRR-NUC domain-containing protein [Cohnella nanjingensis]|uniref:VRR-NUC domain-containing protein n=1 Tax=Cohnella nanjingensis TaxID=1387779 RepID=A0A7X0RPY3_9BACL|nr:VRR-NUC domain-containing protein [Cohnella nanjingensis]MBB6670260.1 VRR-NUC domain-containing protein [Cohnella nanjingensis]